MRFVAALCVIILIVVVSLLTLFAVVGVSFTYYADVRAVPMPSADVGACDVVISVLDERGDILAEFGATETGVLSATLDLEQAKRHRAAFGFFRDRRPELYGRLTEDI